MPSTRRNYGPDCLLPICLVEAPPVQTKPFRYRYGCATQGAGGTAMSRKVKRVRPAMTNDARVEAVRLRIAKLLER